MEITGFDEQIGFLPKINLPKINLTNPIPKNLTGSSFLKNKIQAIKPAVKPNVSLTNLANKAKAMQVPQRTREQILQQAVEKAKQRGIVPQRTREQILQQAVEKAKQTGKSLIVNTPAGVKKLTPKTAFNLVPTASKAPSSFFKRALAPIKKD
jgi:hypothetical protein